MIGRGEGVGLGGKRDTASSNDMERNGEYKRGEDDESLSTSGDRKLRVRR